MIISLNDFLKNNLQSPNRKKYLLAVSGGVDSMVLLSLFHHQKLSFQVAHINYHLRGENSMLDQKVVEDYCKNHCIPFHLYNVSEKDNKPQNGSIQLWARELRYDFFRKIMHEKRLDFLVTAHHLDDQLETFLINLARGTGIGGLCGIPSNENAILRPLLSVSKEEIYEFAKTNHIPFREDLSNKKNDYLRNKIRNKISPILKEIQPNFLHNFQKTIQYLEDTQSVAQQKVEEIFDEISEKKAEKLYLRKEKLAQQNDFVKFEILKKYGFNSSSEINKMFSAQVGSFFHFIEYQLLADRDFLILIPRKHERTNEEQEQKETLFNEKDCIQDDKGNLSLHLPILSQNSVCYIFDAEKLSFPLKLRHRKEGDVFYPIGMQGKKKLSKYLKDEKFSVFQKEEVLLLVNAKDEILAVLSHRQDRRFLPTEKTQKVLKIITLNT